MGSAGTYSINQYIYMFVAEDATDEVDTAVGAGYSGRNKNSYYLSKVNTTESSQLHCSNRVCDCDTCMKLKWVCLLTPRNFEREAETIPLGPSIKLNQKS